MSRKVWLIRHAHTKVATQGMLDKERELSQVGIMQARQLQQWLRQHIKPSDICHILCSTATRTIQTLQIVLPERASSATFMDQIYNANNTNLCELVDEHLGLHSSNHLLLVGHNPGISQLASQLIFSNGEYLDMNPGTIVALTGEAPLKPKNWKLNIVLHPNDN